MANAWATRAACRWPIPAMTNGSEILVHEKRKKPSIIFAVSETDRYARKRRQKQFLTQNRWRRTRKNTNGVH